jgi:hypothetical protein
MRGARGGSSHQPGNFVGFEVMILRRNRGLAASPPVRYRLKMAESLTVRITVADQTITPSSPTTPRPENSPTNSPHPDLPRLQSRREGRRTTPPPDHGRRPRRRRPDINDIGYYAPSRSLVFYYGDVGYWNGTVRIGRFTDRDIELIERQPDGFQVTIERS